MPARIRLPLRGDFITLEAPREQSAVAIRREYGRHRLEAPREQNAIAICVGHTRDGALRLRRVSPRPAGSRGGCFEKITTYRGTWRPLLVTDPRHPAFDPAPDACLEELGL